MFCAFSSFIRVYDLPSPEMVSLFFLLFFAFSTAFFIKIFIKAEVGILPSFFLLKIFLILDFFLFLAVSLGTLTIDLLILITEEFLKMLLTSFFSKSAPLGYYIQQHIYIFW